MYINLHSFFSFHVCFWYVVPCCLVVFFLGNLNWGLWGAGIPTAFHILHTCLFDIAAHITMLNFFLYPTFLTWRIGPAWPNGGSSGGTWSNSST